jgi:hypothetical protein
MAVVQQIANVAYRKVKLAYKWHDMLTKGNSCVHMAAIAYKWQTSVAYRWQKIPPTTIFDEKRQNMRTGIHIATGHPTNTHDWETSDPNHRKQAGENLVLQISI